MLKFWGWGNETKDERLARLEDEVVKLEGEITKLNDSLTQATIDAGRKDANNAVGIHEIRTEHSLKVADLERRLGIANAAIKNGIADGITREKREMEKEEVRREQAHNARIQKLEREHAEKMGKLDRGLENDKASYRKYLRTEMNSRIDKAEALAAKLQVENARLQGENTALIGSNKFFTGKQESMIDMLTLVVKALPTVSAEITTPEVNINNVPPAPKNNGGEQKKN